MSILHSISDLSTVQSDILRQEATALLEGFHSGQEQINQSKSNGGSLKLSID